MGTLNDALEVVRVPLLAVVTSTEDGVCKVDTDLAVLSVFFLTTTHVHYIILCPYATYVNVPRTVIRAGRNAAGRGCGQGWHCGRNRCRGHGKGGCCWDKARDTYVCCVLI
jgi:hypothetical protein